MGLNRFFCLIGLHRWGPWHKAHEQCVIIAHCNVPGCFGTKRRQIHTYEYESIDIMDYRGHKGVCEECGKEVVESHHWISHVFDDDEGKDLSVVEICSMCGVKR